MATFNNAYKDYNAEFENFESDEFESDEFEWEAESGVFSEAELMELAGELLEVNSEAELDQFLGKLFKQASKAVGSFVRSPTGKMIGGLLKGVAKKALPLAGAALGGMVGGPLGANIGSGLASAAGGALGLEAEMMEAEDREFEGAKQFVRLTGDAIKTAADAAPNANPAAIAQSAVMAAVQKHAPNLTPPPPKPKQAIPRTRNSGRWIRQGNSIRLIGLQL